MAKSSKPRKRKPQKKRKEFKKMNPREQFLSMYQDLDKVANDLSQLLDILPTTETGQSEQHQATIQLARTKLIESRSASVELFNKHLDIQQRFEQKLISKEDENLEYCLLGSDIYDHTANLTEAFGLLEPIVAEMK